MEFPIDMNGQYIRLNDIMLYEDGVTIFAVKAIYFDEDGVYILDSENNRYPTNECEHYYFSPGQEAILNSFKNVMNFAYDTQILQEVKNLYSTLLNIFDNDYKEKERWEGNQ